MQVVEVLDFQLLHFELIRVVASHAEDLSEVPDVLSRISHVIELTLSFLVKSDRYQLLQKLVLGLRLTKLHDEAILLDDEFENSRVIKLGFGRS